MKHYFPLGIFLALSIMLLLFCIAITACDKTVHVYRPVVHDTTFVVPCEPETIYISRPMRQCPRGQKCCNHCR